MNRQRNFIWILALVFILSACTVGDDVQVDQIPITPSPLPPTLTGIPTESSQKIPTASPSPTPEPSATPILVLPPEPIEVVFTAADGQELSGSYYPAGEVPAPIIVLMTWSRGNQSEWEEIAYWLQGRGLLVRELNSRETWKSSNWYPERTLDMPLGVFTFNFRSCESEDGCQAYLPVEWLLDAQAALEAAVQLEGVDPEKVITAGASNGADGAVDACAWMNTTDRGICLGAFALSPSSSLTIDFRTAATTLLSQKSPAVVYCLYGLLDDAAEETCDNFPEIRAVSYGYVEDHGLELILVDRRPDPLQILQEFINDALGVEQ